ncbi:Clp protease ClpP [Bradyrhizobium ottawaense]|uniref:head maturation protease, ClpP-related n=1 Tax=Bradyrhizobium ottawaense TaxID=931866 RepID=UPI0027149B78|nr:head maturation protease, ClpP-related [Bradyrhizobium ottawaense]WLB43028.1 Clp protease ClpP [Bradyrhizobium ottawaense]
MRDRRLFDLFAANAKRGTFRADAASNTIELYDLIVSSEIEAEWYGGVSLQGFAKAMRGMSGTVHLRINSPGGDVFAGVGIAQIMREYDGEIVAHVDGYAASAASVVAIAADKVVMAPASMMMIHKAWTWGIGNADDLMATAELLEKIDGQLAEGYAARGSKDAAAFMALMAAETWLTPQEAIDCGLADELAGDKDKSATNARARWDVSAFEHARVQLAADPSPDKIRAAVEAALAARDQQDLEKAAAIAAAEHERGQRQRRAHLHARTA